MRRAEEGGFIGEELVGVVLGEHEADRKVGVDAGDLRPIGLFPNKAI